MNKKAWKITAIIFIILFIVETLILISIFNLGNKAIENENTCVYQICELGEPSSKYDSYYYDTTEDFCYCYKNNEVAKKKYIG
ncbi:MAG: hypothetical protein ACOC3Z_01980 [Nanoarchaeota archaeon]